MSDKMTPVYSGGLLYEYALEANGFGIAKIPSPKAKDIEKKEGFDKFAKALKQNPAPKGDGGYTSTTRAVACPTKDADWLVDSTLLPAIPEGAQKVYLFPYMPLFWLVSSLSLTSTAVHVGRRRDRAGAEGGWFAERWRRDEHR